jgi:transposase
MAAFYVGLDVHSKSSTYVVQSTDGAEVGSGTVPTSTEGLLALRDRFALPAATPVGLETGTVSFFVARQLLRIGLVPVVIDAHEVRAKAHRPTQKSDRRDALAICDGLRSGQYRSIVHVPPLAISTLRDTLSRRRHFVQQQTREVNAAKRLVRAAGLGVLVRGSLHALVGWSRLLRALHDEPQLCDHVALHQSAWQTAADQVATLETRLRALAIPHAADFARLQTVPGVGPIVALTTIAIFSDVQRFPSAKHAASYAGLVPSTYQSGDRDAHGHITRRGSAELRAMLCEAAHHACRPQHPLHPYFARLCVLRGHKMAVVALAHRLCRILFAMLRTGSEFDVTKLAVEAGPFEKKVVHHWRLKRVTTTST